MAIISDVEQLRKVYHRELLTRVLFVKAGKDGEQTISVADTGSLSSTRIAAAWAANLASEINLAVRSGQTAGSEFEAVTREFLRDAFSLLSVLRPGNWETAVGTTVGTYDQYNHLEQVEAVLNANLQMKTVFGVDYLVKPDIVVFRHPIAPEDIGGRDAASRTARLAPLLADSEFAGRPILHASVSCKLTICSDRAQNTRTEALNLIRNRKGRLPHIVAVTAEPTPNRLASLALGTGDMRVFTNSLMPLVRWAVKTRKICSQP